MTARIKPTDQDLIDWCHAWDSADHRGKLNLCEAQGITYDTGKHWRSETNVPKEEAPSAVPSPEEEPSKGEQRIEDMLQILGEIVTTTSRVDLDFVSFDIETTNLKADFSVMLCACIKPYGQDTMVWRGDDYPGWENQRADDSQIVQDVSTELSKHAIIVTHYGTGFDIPYLRAKMVRYGLPPLPPMFGVDTYYIAKKNFLVSRRRLAALAEYFQLGKKEGVEGNLWMAAAMNGDTTALDTIVKHCELDVVILEKLAAISFPYLKSIRRL